MKEQSNELWCSNPTPNFDSINTNERKMSYFSTDSNRPIDALPASVNWAVDEEDDDVLDDDEEIDDNTGEIPVPRHGRYAYECICIYIHRNTYLCIHILSTDPINSCINIYSNRRRQGGRRDVDEGPHVEAAATFVAGVLPPDLALEREVRAEVRWVLRGRGGIEGIIVVIVSSYGVLYCLVTIISYVCMTLNIGIVIER
jgi:hypothetical protein